MRFNRVVNKGFGNKRHMIPTQTQNDETIPVYNLRNCTGATDFAIVRVDPFQILGKLQVPHRQEGYTMNLLLQGRVTKYIDFERHTIEGPALFSGGPHQVHQYDAVEDAELICISFSRDFLINEMQGWIACWECMFNKVIHNLDADSMDELLGYANLMLDEFRRNKPKKELVLRNLLNIFIISSARLMGSSLDVMQMDATKNRLVQQFKYFVDTAFRNVTKVAGYAEMLSVTPGHLNDVIKITTGKTAKQIIDEKRIVEAKRLLFWGDHNLKEIAALLNFENDSYFNRYFKKHTGQSPALFQRAIREKYN